MALLSLDSTRMTIPKAKRQAKVACSAGAGNAYKHPFWMEWVRHHDRYEPAPPATAAPAAGPGGAAHG